jgi:3-methyladenine DNA glycosylase AlkC
MEDLVEDMEEAADALNKGWKHRGRSESIARMLLGKYTDPSNTLRIMHAC